MMKPARQNDGEHVLRGLREPMAAAHGLGSPKAGQGVRGSLLGTTKRTDGNTEVTYDGHPLYYFSGDSGAGQANGQGSDNFGAKWWLVAPSGAKITASDTAAAAAANAPAPSAPTTAGSSNAGGGWS